MVACVEKMFSVGSVCSGIEAASVAWNPLGFKFAWFSEIADFPSRLLAEKYPSTPNMGDMHGIPELIRSSEISTTDIICGGTPCQAFSLAGHKNGLNDPRGNLAMKFVDVVDANDEMRAMGGLPPSIVFWENVEGILTDKTNAFGNFIAALAGSNETHLRWPSAGVIKGKKRNIAWRVIDAKYFGVPQQRRRLYLLAGGKDFSPENVLFEETTSPEENYPTSPLSFIKDGHKFEIFREYTDCLYSAYGTKWNGNAAAYNGSLYVVQDERIRRLSPLECERLMGLPDNYTNLPGAKRTNRYQAIGNSWAVPVVRWIGARLQSYDTLTSVTQVDANPSPQPKNPLFTTMYSIVSPEAPEEIYISPTGCYGIVRRKNERKLRMNSRLEEVLLNISSAWSQDEIERRSRVQKRGRFSTPFLL